MSQSVSRRPRQRSARVLGYLSAALAAGVVWAICNNSSTGPDVIVASLYGIDNYVQGTPIDGKRAYAMGTKSLNQGDQTLLWQGSTVLHPVIGQGLYRLKTDADRPGGRLEQIGISWLKHGFTALAQNEFCTAASGNGTGCDNPGTGSLLGLGCSDPYSSGLNGSNGTQGTAAPDLNFGLSGSTRIRLGEHIALGVGQASCAGDVHAGIGWVGLELARKRMRAHVPHEHPFIGASAGQPAAICAERD